MLEIQVMFLATVLSFSHTSALFFTGFPANNWK